MIASLFGHGSGAPITLVALAVSVPLFTGLHLAWKRWGL